MKQKKIICYVYIVLCMYVPMHGSTVTPATRRAWDIASAIEVTAQTVESKICTIVVDTQQGYNGTFTALEALDNTIDAVLPIESSIKSILDVLQYDLSTIISKVDVIKNETSAVDQNLDNIRINDFGGTWTALDNIESVLCNKLETALDDLATIDSKIDALTTDNLAQFIATFTKLQEVSMDVFDTMTKAQYFSDQITSDLVNIDSLIDSVQSRLMTVDSKVSVLDITINTQFASTFTVIQDIAKTFITINSKVNYLNGSVTTEFANTFTTIAALDKRATTINSKIDVISTLVSTVQTRAVTIDSYLDIVDSKICTIDSKVDRLLSRNDSLDSLVGDLILDFTTINSKVNLIDTTALLQKAYTIESRTDYLGLKATTVNSKVAVLDTRHNTIQSVLDYTARIAQTTFSKVNILDSEVDVVNLQITTIQSKLDRIYTINSKIDLIDRSTDTLANQWNTINSKIDRVDSSIDQIARGMRSTESKVATIQSVVDVSEGRLITINSLIDTITSKVSTLIPVSKTIESKLCVIESICEETNSDLDTMRTRLNSANINARERSIDFQETWTIIDSMQRSIVSTQSRASTVSSVLDTLSVTVDQNGTYTVIDLLTRKECTIESKVDHIQDSLNRINLLSYKGSFTMLNEILTKLSEVDSLIDTLSITVTALSTDAFGCTGIPIYQSSLVGGSYTITNPGNYYLAEDLYATTAGSYVILISGDNVSLNLNGKTIFGQTIKGGISVTGTRNNIAIFNGRVADCIGDGILIANITNVVMEDLFVEYCGYRRNGTVFSGGTDGVNFGGTTATNFLIRRVIVEFSGNDGWDMESGMVNGLVEDLHVLRSGDGGMDWPGATGQNVIIRNSSVDAVGRGISITGTRFLVENCRATNVGSGGGIALAGSNHVVRNCTIERCPSGITAAGTGGHVIVNNDVNQNTTAGITNTSANNVIMFNRVINNGTNINGAGVGTILGNYAINATGTANYSITGTVITGALSTVQHTKPFPSPTPTYWYNVSAIP